MPNLNFVSGNKDPKKTLKKLVKKNIVSRTSVNGTELFARYYVSRKTIRDSFWSWKNKRDKRLFRQMQRRLNEQENSGEV